MVRTRLVLLPAACAVAVLLTAAAALAGQKPISQSDAVTATFTIEAIDHTQRIVTLKGEDGEMQDVLCGPEVQRFDALKVGDRVTFRYYESIVSSIRRPGEAQRPMASGGVTRTPGSRPGGTLSEQATETVTIQAIDQKVPSVRVKDSSGREMSVKVQDAKNLQGYKVGDMVEITYTKALAVSVTPAK